MCVAYIILCIVYIVSRVHCHISHSHRSPILVFPSPYDAYARSINIIGKYVMYLDAVIPNLFSELKLIKY